MLPTYYVPLPALPLNSNGKIDTTFGVDIGLAAFLQAPTVSALATLVDRGKVDETAAKLLSAQPVNDQD